MAVFRPSAHMRRSTVDVKLESMAQERCQCWGGRYAILPKMGRAKFQRIVDYLATLQGKMSITKPFKPRSWHQRLPPDLMADQDGILV